MGNAVLCLFPTSGLSSSSSTSTSSTSFPFPSFGFIPHRSRSHRKKSFALRPNQPKFTDLHQLRMKILQDISLTFPEPTIIILYAPPEFQIQEVGDFISQKVHLPLLDLDSLALRNVNESNNQDSENLECAFESRILDPDCLKGFVVLGYPETPKQLRSLRTNLPSFVTVPIFIDLDSEVTLVFFLSKLSQAMRRLRDRFDRWVHEPTDRSYHALSRPPLSLQGKPFVPTSKSMLDDHTGDPLVHVSSFTFDLFSSATSGVVMMSLTTKRSSCSITSKRL